MAVKRIALRIGRDERSRIEIGFGITVHEMQRSNPRQTPAPKGEINRASLTW
jgi:hypothetical protein